LSLRDVGHTIALLMHSQVADVTEENDIAIVAFIIQTHTAESIFINE
jgi:hypothetical protein